MIQTLASYCGSLTDRGILRADIELDKTPTNWWFAGVICFQGTLLMSSVSVFAAIAARLTVAGALSEPMFRMRHRH